MEDEDIIELAKEAGVYTEWEDNEQWLVMPESCFPKFAELIASVVRKECAEVIEQLGMEGYGTLAIAAQIRKM
jgi:hypothetical protein